MKSFAQSSMYNGRGVIDSVACTPGNNAQTTKEAGTPWCQLDNKMPQGQNGHLGLQCALGQAMFDIPGGQCLKNDRKKKKRNAS
jgi:hypothetical protein